MLGNLDLDSRPKQPERKSLRKKKNVIRHQLLLGPTLERQERMRRLQEKERAKLEVQQTTQKETKVDIDDDDLPISQVIIPLAMRKVSPVAPDILGAKIDKELKTKRETKKADSKTPAPAKKTLAIKKQIKVEKSKTSTESRKTPGVKAVKPKKPHRPLRTPEPVQEATVSERIQERRTQHRTPQKISRPLFPSIPRLSPSSSTIHAITPEHPDTSMESSSLDELRKMELQAQHRLIILKRRKVAIQSLVTAMDFASIYASLAIVKELHVGVLHFNPMAAALVTDAEVAGRLLLTQSLMDRFTGIRVFGGLAFSEGKARALIDHLFQTVELFSGTIPITARLLVRIGVPSTDAIDMVPHIRVIVDEIQTKVFYLSRMLRAVTAEGSIMDSARRSIS